MARTKGRAQKRAEEADHFVAEGSLRQKEFTAAIFRAPKINIYQNISYCYHLIIGASDYRDRRIFPRPRTPRQSDNLCT